MNSQLENAIQEAMLELDRMTTEKYEQGTKNNEKVEDDNETSIPRNNKKSLVR